VVKLRISIPIVKASDDKTHWFSVEKNDDIATFYIDEDVIGETDFENVEELVEAIGLVWGNWIRTEKKEAEP
jgi:hypothetical protein